MERGGNVRAQVVTDVTGRTLKSAIRECVHEESRIITDENPSYEGIGIEFDGGHETVNHGRKEYARGDVNTNSIESFFALIKRGIVGTFHNVSKRHLHRYLGEFEFRYNTRQFDDGLRLVTAIKSAEGKRLMYSQPIAA